MIHTCAEFDLSLLKCDRLKQVETPKFPLDPHTIRMLMNFLPIAVNIDYHQPFNDFENVQSMTSEM